MRKKDVMTGISEPKRVEVNCAWKRFDSEKLRSMYTSPNFINMRKSIIIRWAELTARMGERNTVLHTNS